jgi:RHH-type rel operon transcriptional repressor/antitoxin RelB
MTLGVRLPEELEKRLSSLAKETHRSKTYYVTEALRAQTHERDLRAIEVYEEQRRNGTLKTYSLEEIKKRHGLD